MFWNKKNRITYQLEIAGMHCVHCETTVKIALYDSTDVKKVNIKKRKWVEVEMKKDTLVQPAELVRVVEALGYHAKVLES